jgi:iron complex outermembrane receptor protein/hemoglobin/transferrin/lactoferrin receptor protein
MNFTTVKKYLAAGLFLILGGILFTPHSFAQTSNSSAGVIKGTVTTQNGKPIIGVNVGILNSDQGTVTQADGSYILTGLSPGTFTISFSFIGYGTVKKHMTVKKGQTRVLNVTLKQTSQKLSRLVVTGTAVASSSLTAPAEINSISGHTKLASQQTSLGASLDKLAGVSTIQSGPTMGKPVIHGLHGTRIRVLQNGVASDFEQFGSDHGPNVDPFIAKRIEVVKGAASVQYGSNALGGAVNIISRPVPDAMNKPSFIGGEVMSSYAANNSEYSGGLHLHGASGRLGFTGTLVKRTAGDLHTPKAATYEQTHHIQTPRISGKLPNTDFGQLNGSLGLGYTTDAGPVTLRYDHWHSNQNSLNPTGEPAGQNLENNTVHLKAELDLGRGFTIKPGFTFNSNLRQEAEEGTPRSKLPPSHGYASLDLLIHSFTSNLKLQHPSVGPFKGTLAAEYLHENRHTRGDEPLVPSGTINNFGSYLFETANFNRFTLSVGLRIDVRSQKADPNKKLKLPNYQAGQTDAVLNHSYFAFSGSLGGSYKLTQHFVIAANAGRGFRAPSFFNLYAYGVDEDAYGFFIGDPNLRPAHSLSTQLSLRWQSKNLSAKLTGYRNYIRNYMFTTNTSEVNQNGLPILKDRQGIARLLGMDVHFKAHARPWLQLHGTFDLVKGRNVDDALPNIGMLPLLPASHLAGGIKFMKSHLGVLQNGYVGLSVKHVFSKKAAGPYEPFWYYNFLPPYAKNDYTLASTNAYTLLNASLGFELPLWNRPVSFVITADNLLNKAYRDFLNTYKGYALNPGRGITFKINIPFGVR